MSTRASTRIGLVVAGALTVLLIGSAIAGVRVTSRPGFCLSCHEMQPLHGNWKRGSHAEVSCVECHVDATLSGQVTAKLNGLRQVYVHFTRPVDLAKVQTSVPSARCVRCHDTSDALKLGLRVATAHNKHREAKLDCTVCHLTTGHSRQRFVGFELKSCQECHPPERTRATEFFLRDIACTRPPG